MGDTWLSARDFIEADVIKWVEGIFERKGKKNPRSVRVGERTVVAEVVRDGMGDDWALLLVLRSELTTSGTDGKARALEAGSTVRRKRATILRGSVERLQWSEEDVRERLCHERSERRPVGPRSRR